MAWVSTNFCFHVKGSDTTSSKIGAKSVKGLPNAFPSPKTHMCSGEYVASHFSAMTATHKYNTDRRPVRYLFVLGGYYHCRELANINIRTLFMYIHYAYIIHRKCCTLDQVRKTVAYDKVVM